MQTFENICRDDDDLYEFLPVLSKIKGFFILLKEDEKLRSAMMKFNDEFSLGFGEDLENETKYLVVNGVAFKIGKRPSAKYREQMERITDFFGVDERKFHNKVLIPWVCEVLNVHFELEAADLSHFLI